MKIKECENIYIYKEYMEMETIKIDDGTYVREFLDKIVNEIDKFVNEIDKFGV